MRPRAEIDADLAAAYAARRKCLDVGQSWSSPAGLSAAHAALTEINATIATLQAEAQGAELAAAGRSSIQFVPTVRGL